MIVLGAGLLGLGAKISVFSLTGVFPIYNLLDGIWVLASGCCLYLMNIRGAYRTPGFSTFAVTARVAAREEKPTQVPVALVGVVGAIVAVAVIAVVLRRRRGPAPAEPQVR
jgi:hypothetical protein